MPLGAQPTPRDGASSGSEPVGGFGTTLPGAANGAATGSSAGKHMALPFQTWPHQHRPWSSMMQAPPPQQRGSSDTGGLQSSNQADAESAPGATTLKGTGLAWDEVEGHALALALLNGSVAGTRSAVTGADRPAGHAGPRGKGVRVSPIVARVPRTKAPSRRANRANRGGGLSSACRPSAGEHDQRLFPSQAVQQALQAFGQAADRRGIGQGQVQAALAGRRVDRDAWRPAPRRLGAFGRRGGIGE